jgi:tripartite-type tricarboxylate transporter receptor subunit TctC
MRWRLAGTLACLAVLAWGADASAFGEDYPARPIRIIVPTAAGGLADLSARVFAQKLEERTKQAVIADNRPGAGGIIGAEFAAKSPPDGYTLMIGAQQWMAILPSLKSDLPYDPVKDFVPVAQMVRAPLILVVHPSVPAKTVADLVALAKAQPGKLSYGSAGRGSMGQLTAEEFKQLAGVDIVGVSYKGVAPATQDLMAGHLTLTFDLVPNVTQQVRAGLLRALAVTVPERVTALPEVPTMAEAGLPDVQAINWFALFAPAKTPPAIVAWLNRQADEIFASPDVRQRFEAENVMLPGGPPEALGAYMAEERARWRRVIDKAGLKLE